MMNTKHEITRKEKRRSLLDHYCKHMLMSPENPTITHAAEFPGSDGVPISHDAIRRALDDGAIRPAELWKNVSPDIVWHKDGYIVFDDSVMDKNHARKIEPARRQYSGNGHCVLNGIGVVTCVYVNPATDEWWPIDYRVYDPDSDGKSKLDHMVEMLHIAVRRSVVFSCVLMDSWYACKRVMLEIEALGKCYVCPIHSNRCVDVNGVDAKGKGEYTPVNKVDFSGNSKISGHLAKLRGFPKNHKVRLFQVVAENGDVEFVVTNLEGLVTTQDVQLICALRWKIEQFHRELKQNTGIEGCQCRKSRIQRNHIACSMRVLLALRKKSIELGVSIYGVWDKLMFEAQKAWISSPMERLGFAHWLESTKPKPA